MFCQWFNPLEHLSASSSNSEVNSHPVHGLIHEGGYIHIYKLNQWLNLQKTYHMMLA